MAPKSLFSLSTSFSLFTLPHNLKNPKPNLLLKTSINSNKPTLIICKFTNSQNQEQQSTSISSTSAIEFDGIGAASPTRGDLFLSRQQSIEAAAVVLSTTKKKPKKPKKPKVSTSIASCYGCGAPLQTVEVDAPGYVDLQTYELGYCGLLLSVDFYFSLESHKLLVDIVDFNGSFLARIRDLAGSNPIILVITKVDLLPKGTDFNCIGDWVVEATTKKKLNVISVHLTSSKSLVGIVGVASEIQKEKKGRDVYILGAANVGKSAFINALLKMMSDKDPIAAVARKYKPIQSAVPGTTLGPIQIDAFLGEGKLFDTPGVHLHHRQAAVIHSEDLPSLAPQSRLRGRSFPIVSSENTMNKTEATDLNGFSIFWGGLVRVDVLKVLPSTRLTFYGPKALQIHMVPTAEADEFYQEQVGVLLTPPSGKQRADDWAGLQTVRDLQIKSENSNRPACDVAISGLGWISVEPTNVPIENSNSESFEESTGELHLVVHVPKPVEIFVRPPLPVGKTGGKWYEYRDLTEKEEELRPKWYF
ncbi:No-associated protein 1 protein [Thalictrum thalictroides]|uniref:No-associated protein 1 protein n=1 Tax=Thalictrum thalictroides TaxID=46969 RepID=A0A7J6V533_THATH|nr:No-associated protein 1 protein [Thalictrum thalictroides]